MITDTDWAYAAGVIDGEGCIFIAYLGPKNHAFALRVSVGSSSREVLEWLATRFEGTVRPHSGGCNRQMYTWKVQARQAHQFLIGVLPYLIIKREEALQAMHYYDEWPIDQPKRGRRGLHVASEELERRLALRNELQRLKGPSAIKRLVVSIPFRPSTVPMAL